MSVKNLLGKVKELREDMESCQERMTHLLQDYQLNVLQTAAVIAAAKINEEKAEIEKKRQCLREQIEKEKRRGRETVDKVYKSAGETIQALIRDHEKEIQEAMQRRHRVRNGRKGTHRKREVKFYKDLHQFTKFRYKTQSTDKSLTLHEVQSENNCSTQSRLRKEGGLQKENRLLLALHVGCKRHAKPHIVGFVKL